MSDTHPCLGCGACCAWFRVQFEFSETSPGHPHFVPESFVEPLAHSQATMKGTTKKHRPSCVALSGRVGNGARCSIYENRPSPCREFEASFANGKKNRRCDEARMNHGLAPLTKRDWDAWKEKAQPPGPTRDPGDR